MEYITGKYSCWLLVIGCWLLAACSSENSGESTSSQLRVMAYTAAYQEATHQMRAVSEGYMAYTPDHDIAIGLYILPQEETPTVQVIRYSSEEWHSQAKVKGGEDYRIYGYMPKKDPIASTITELANGDVRLVLSDIDAVIADDVCFVTGVKDLTGDVLQGSFAYEGKSDNNNVRILMDHLFASVKFSFSVDAQYSALRTIKLKSFRLISTAASVTATVTLRPNTEGADPVQSVSYESQTGTASSITFFESMTGEDITGEAVSNYACCFAPTLSNTLSLVSTYDVYDKAGNKIREDCAVTNRLPDLRAERGQRVTLALTIAPTYLYQLSEPDLDNPTVIVN